MAKTTKMPPAKNSKTITDFFQRAPSSSQGSTGASSRPRLKGESTTTTPTQSQSSTGASKLAISTKVTNGGGESSRTKASEATPCDSGMAAHASTSTGAKRERTLTMQSVADNGEDKVSASQNTSSQSNSRKKPRTSPPISISSTSSCVPSSQSDEDELTPALPVPLTSQNPKTTVQTANHWQKDTPPPTPGGINRPPSPDAMDVDEPLPTPNVSEPVTPTTDYSAHGPNSHSEASSPLVNHQVLTPPYTDVSSDDGSSIAPEIPTQLEMDANARAQRIIEESRARAYDGACSSPEATHKPLDDLSDLSSGSSDEEDDLPVSLMARPPALNSSSSSSGGPRRSSRQLQKASARVTRDGSPVSRSTRNQRASTSKVTIPSLLRKSKPQKNSCLETLLKEKVREERKGGGAEAFAQAEKSQGILLEDAGPLDTTEWGEAQVTDMINTPASWDQSIDAINRVDVDEKEAQRLFGERSGKEISSILLQDKKVIKEEMAKYEAEGVPLWSRHEGDAMMVDCTSLTFNYTGPSATLKQFSNVIRQEDYSKAVFILKSGVFAHLRLGNEIDVVDQLGRLALSQQQPALSAAAFHAVLQALHRQDLPTGWRLSSSFIIETLVQLGARQDSLEADGLTTTLTRVNDKVTDLEREDALRRLVVIVTHALKLGRAAPEDISDLVVSLIRVALEPETSYVLRVDIIQAVDLACHYLSADAHLNAECQLTRRLAELSAKYDIVNKRMLLHILNCGTGNTLRISRILAYVQTLELPSESIEPFEYNDPPPLKPLMNALSQTNGRAMRYPTTRAFQLDDDTDYLRLKDSLYFFAVATSNIQGYVEEFKQSTLNRPTNAYGSPVKPRDVNGVTATEISLEGLRKAIENFGNSIKDPRAAHIERTRVKSILKQLESRIYYQTRTYERAWRDRQTERVSLKNWLKPKATAQG